MSAYANNSISKRAVGLPGVTLLAAALSWLLPVTGKAQSMMVIGNNSSAEACYRSAGLAAQFRHAELAALRSCNDAIEHGNLLLADLSATHVNRGIIHAARSDYELALADYRKAEKHVPNSPEVALNIGNLWFISGHFQQAIERYDFALKNELPKQHIAFFNRGMAFENAGKKERAAADYERALELAPEWDQVAKRLLRLRSPSATKEPTP